VVAGGSVGSSGSGSVVVGVGSLGVGWGLVGRVVGLVVGASLVGLGFGFEYCGGVVASRVQVSVTRRTGRSLSSLGTSGTGWVEVGVGTGVVMGRGAGGTGAPSTAASAGRPAGVA
jgi:hypothetical protein